tara:strand:- start:2165 stop:2320 length:156 start_codon:yes stop_codon:yes gene_type:complete
VGRPALLVDLVDLVLAMLSSVPEYFAGVYYISNPIVSFCPTTDAPPDLIVG